MTCLLRHRSASRRPQGFPDGPGARLVQPFRRPAPLDPLEPACASSLLPFAPTVF